MNLVSQRTVVPLVHGWTVRQACLWGAALTFLANAVSGAAPSSRPPFPGAPFVGLGNFLAADPALVEEIGWKFVRLPVSWHEVERPDRTLDWSLADSRLQEAKAVGLRTQITLSFAWPRGKEAPCRMDPATRLPADAEGQAEMARFVEQAAARYASAVHAWGVEEDLSARAFPADAKTYAALLRLVSERVRAADDEARVAFGALAFDTMEADQRVFYVADAVASLGADSKAFDALEVRVIGGNGQDDCLRIPAAVDHACGQLAGTPYANAAICLIASAPSGESAGQGETDQAADLARSVLMAAQCGVSRFYWGGGLGRGVFWPPDSVLASFPSVVERSALVSGEGGHKKKAFYTARLLSRLQERHKLTQIHVDQVKPTLFHAEIPAIESGRDLVIVWRNYFASGKEVDASESLELKKVDIEGPARQDLHAMKMVPDSEGEFYFEAVPDKYYDLAGAPTILSQDVEFLSALAENRPLPPPSSAKRAEEPTDTPAAETPPSPPSGTKQPRQRLYIY
ncbi:MAG: hypothetical protein NTW86_28310 [Candidatus Sumerlaeota bacterium]|nr:hypothetical protein [Candidatus Sumerlaeota bacterium]